MSGLSPVSSHNDRVTGGIERLLPNTAFTEAMIDIKQMIKPDGTEVTIKSVKKVDLCNYLCKTKRELADFEGFRPLVAMLDELRQQLSSEDSLGSRAGGNEHPA